MDNMTPHYKTKSFWFTLGTYIVSGLVLTGVLAPEKEGQAGDMTHQVVQAISLATTFFSSLYYVDKRKQEKKAVDNKNKLPTKPVEPKPKTKRKPRKKKPE